MSRKLCTRCGGIQPRFAKSGRLLDCWSVEARGGAPVLTLPWPPKELSPNARVHWATRARAAKAFREQAYYLAKNAKLPRVAFDGPIGFQVRFCPPDKRHRDDDNLISAFKAARDGIADALGVNDRRFAASYLFDPHPTKGGAVIVTVEGIQ